MGLTDLEGMEFDVGSYGDGFHSRFPNFQYYYAWSSRRCHVVSLENIIRVVQDAYNCSFMVYGLWYCVWNIIIWKNLILLLWRFLNLYFRSKMWGGAIQVAWSWVWSLSYQWILLHKGKWNGVASVWCWCNIDFSLDFCSLGWNSGM